MPSDFHFFFRVFFASSNFLLRFKFFVSTFFIVLFKDLLDSCDDFKRALDEITNLVRALDYLALAVHESDFLSVDIHTTRNQIQVLFVQNASFLGALLRSRVSIPKHAFFDRLFVFVICIKDVQHRLFHL